MTESVHPPIVSREDWLTARQSLLQREKALTREYDAVNAERRRLPMVRLETEYTFRGPEGEVSLLDLFSGRRQLIVYHFMFDPAWDKGCPGCTGLVNALGDLSMLAARDTSFVLISRAPLEKLEAYRTLQGWNWPWYSSFESRFNYDFHVTLDKTIVPLQYNYMPEAELLARRARNEPFEVAGESHGYSVFFQNDGAVFHTYSTYGRGAEGRTNAYALLDMTPFGRQESFEDSPAGWPQKPTYGG